MTSLRASAGFLIVHAVTCAAVAAVFITNTLSAHAQQPNSLGESTESPAKMLGTHLREYLTRTYPCQITRVAVNEQDIRIEGHVGSHTQDLWLAEVPMHAKVTELRGFDFASSFRPLRMAASRP
jgi:hypothetical protein